MAGTSPAKTSQRKLGSASYANSTGYRNGRRGVPGLKVLCSSKSRQLRALDLNLHLMAVGGQIRPLVDERFFGHLSDTKTPEAVGASGVLDK